MADVTAGYVQSYGGFYRISDRSGPYSIDETGAATLLTQMASGGRYNATLTPLADGSRGDSQLDVNGNERVIGTCLASLGADGQNNSNVSGWFLASNSQTAKVAPAIFPYAFNGLTWDRERKPNNVSRLVSAAASTNATNAKGSNTDIIKIVGLSKRASDCYLKLYNKATAPTVGTDIPALTLAVAAGAQFNFDFHKQYFNLGFGYAFTTGSADGDTGALTAGDIVGFNATFT
jgi:hypothetical protein